MALSAETPLIRPDELMAELGIKKSKYYEVLKDLGVKAKRDLENKSYLSPEDAEKVRADFSQQESGVTPSNRIVKQTNSNLASSDDSIYVDPEEATASFT